MRTNNVTFGTSLHIGGSQEQILAKQSDKFLDGFIWAGKAMKQNGLNDQIFAEIKTVKKGKKDVDVLQLTYLNAQKNVATENPATRIVSLSWRGAKQVKNFIMDTLKKNQPEDFRAKAIQTKTQKPKSLGTKAKKAEHLIAEYGYDDSFYV